MSKSDISATKRIGWRRYSSLLLNAALLSIAFVAISSYQQRGMLADSRQAAPPLSAPLLQGDTYVLGDVTADATLVYFFAPWCTYCALSSDNLVRLRRMRDASSLHIVAVALDWESKAEVESYVEKHQLNIPVLLGDNDVSRAWQVYAFPTYYVLDNKQRVVDRDMGYSTQLGLWWRSWNVN